MDQLPQRGLSLGGRPDPGPFPLPGRSRLGALDNLLFPMVPETKVGEAVEMKGMGQGQPCCRL